MRKYRKKSTPSAWYTVPTSRCFWQAASPRGSRRLGAEMARLFEREYGKSRPHILITATRADPDAADREQGFMEGFTSVIPETSVTVEVEDLGSIRDTSQAVSASLLENPEVNVLFATSDLRARGALNALVQMGIEEKVLLAGVGGKDRDNQRDRVPCYASGVCSSGHRGGATISAGASRDRAVLRLGAVIVVRTASKLLRGTNRNLGGTTYAEEH